MPTATRTPSPIPTATLTPSPVPTATRTPTAVPTATRPPTITVTPLPRATLTFTPYPSLTPSMTPFSAAGQPTPQPSGCTVPANWVRYTIQPGDTIFGLARRFGTSRDDLVNANCLPNANNITAGQLLFVPPGANVTPQPLPGTGTPATGTGGPYAAINCDLPAATISQPRAGTTVSGTFAVYGTATHPSFQFYRLQISGGGTNDADFATVDVYQQPVENGQLGIIPAGAFAPGDYWIRLTVVDQTGNYVPQCTVRVRFGG